MDKAQRIRRYYGIFLTVMTVVVGVLFIVAAAQVYYGGIAENPFYPYELSRIKEHILLPFIFLLCWIGAIIGGVVLAAVYPIAEKRSAARDSAKTLKNLEERVPASGGESHSAAKAKLAKYKKIRLIVLGFSLAVFLAAAIAIFVYAFGITHYTVDPKADIMSLVKNVISWTGAALAVGIAATIADEVLLKREIKEAKTAIADGDRNNIPPKKEIKRNAVIASSVAASVTAGIALVAYALAPVIVTGTVTLSQTGIYLVVFLLAALLVACFAAYITVKDYIPDKTSFILTNVARGVVGAVAVTFIIVGILDGGANDVLVKAINICTECIGLG